MAPQLGLPPDRAGSIQIWNSVVGSSSRLYSAWRTPDPAFFSACSLEFESGDFVELLSRQLVSPVRFTAAVNKLYASGYDSYLEVGPGSVLSGLVKRIAPEATVARAADADTIGALRDDSRYWGVA